MYCFLVFWKWWALPPELSEGADPWVAKWLSAVPSSKNRSVLKNHWMWMCFCFFCRASLASFVVEFVWQQRAECKRHILLMLMPPIALCVLLAVGQNQAPIFCLPSCMMFHSFSLRPMLGLLQMFKSLLKCFRDIWTINIAVRHCNLGSKRHIDWYTTLSGASKAISTPADGGRWEEIQLSLVAFSAASGVSDSTKKASALLTTLHMEGISVRGV